MTDRDISRRKVLGAVGTVGGAAALGASGTTAFFSDEEQFSNDRLVAGELDVGAGYTAHYSDWSDDEDEGVDDVVTYDGAPGTVGSAAEVPEGYTGLPAADAWLVAVTDPDRFLANTRTGAFPDGDGDGIRDEFSCADVPQAVEAPSPVVDLSDVKPGDFGEVTLDFVLCDNPGYVWLRGGLRSAAENGTTEPESGDGQEDGDADATDPADVELLDVVRAAYWVDDGDNYQDGEESPVAVGTLREVLRSLDRGAGAALPGDIADATGGGTGDRGCFSADARHSLAFAWWVPVDHGNEVQSDAVTFDLGLYAEQCRHNDGTGRGAAFPRDVAEQFLATVETEPDDLVFVGGPVDPGTVVGGFGGAELQVPEAPGTYYVFVVDGEPTAGFAHPVRFAWLDAGDGSSDVVEGSWWPQFSSTPQFEFPDSPTVVGGRRFLFDEGSGPADTDDASDDEPLCTVDLGTLDDGEDDSDDTDPGDGRIECPGLPNVPTPGTDFSDPTNRNYALVLDCGLPRGWQAANVWSAETMAGWGAAAEQWIDVNHAEDNFQVQRISQYGGTAPGVAVDPPSIGPPGDAPFESVPAAMGLGPHRAPSPAYRQLDLVLAAYNSAFLSARDVVDIEFGINFVLVIVAHGDQTRGSGRGDGTQDDGVFMLANPDKTDNVANEFAVVPWRGGLTVDVSLPGLDKRIISYDEGVREWLARFPDWVDVTLIVFSCFSGEGDNAVGPAAEYVVTSANQDNVSFAGSVEAFFNAGRLLSDRHAAMRAVRNEGEQRRSVDETLGPLDE